MDNKEFLEIYKEYQGKSPEKDFKHIPDISFYNFNYYVRRWAKNLRRKAENIIAPTCFE